MSEDLPTVGLDELAELRPEKVASNKDPNLPYIGLEHIAQGQPRLLGFLPSSASVSINCYFSKDDILFGKLRPNLRKSLRAPFAGYCSTDIIVLRARDGVLPTYAAHVFQWERVFAAASATAVGTKMPRTSWNELRRYRVFKTDTEIEQSRISAVLDTVDEAIAKTEAVIAKLRQVRAGLLHDLLTRGLDPNGQLRDPIAHPEQFQDSPLGQIPKEWTIGNVSALAINRDARRVPLKQADRDERHGVYPYFGASGVIDFVDDYLFDGNFVLIGEDGENLRSRQLPLAFIASGKFWVNNHAHILEPLPTTDVRFLATILDAQDYVPWLLGSAQPKLTQRNLGFVQLRIPAPPEQTQISDTLETIDGEIAAAERERSKLACLKSGLMTDLLTGRVRIPETSGTTS